MRLTGVWWLLAACVWSVLALATLALVVRDGAALPAALVAWAGGVLTYPLGRDVVRHLRTR